MKINFENIKIYLKDHKAYPWQNQNNIYFRGFFIYNNKYYNSKKALNLLKEKSLDNIKDIIKTIDGKFLLIVLEKKQVFVATDITRSFPILYNINVKKSKIILSDYLNDEVSKNITIDYKKINNFNNSLFVIKESTLFKNWKQVCGGEFLFFCDKKLKIQKYYNIEYKYDSNKDQEYYLTYYDKKYEESFKNVIKILNGRTAVIPLSGGHDSRLIVYYLDKLNYKNVITYSYGLKDSEENKISKKVSEYFGYKHYFVEYNRNKCKKFYKKIKKQFMVFAGNGTSCPCVQELFAIYTLKQKNIINEKDIVVPGYQNDSLHNVNILNKLLNNTNIKKADIYSTIVDKHLNDAKIKKTSKFNYEKMIKLVEQSYFKEKSKNNYSEKDSIEIIEKFNLFEYQSKYIQNAVRTYEFFGIEWITPFFDRIQIDIISNIPYYFRMGRNNMYELEKKVYSKKLLDLDFIQQKNIKIEKNILKNIKNILLLIFKPEKTHFLLCYFPLETIWKNYIKKAKRHVNMIVKNEYIKLLKRSYK